MRREKQQGGGGGGESTDSSSTLYKVVWTGVDREVIQYVKRRKKMVGENKSFTRILYRPSSSGTVNKLISRNRLLQILELENDPAGKGFSADLI